MLAAWRGLTVALPLTVALSLSALLVASCATTPGVDDPPWGPCLCGDDPSAASCPTDVCDLLLEVDPACAGEVGKVEVLFAGQLERATWAPGERRRTCATVPRGQQAALFARADTPWQWQEVVTCPSALQQPGPTGPTIERVLQCASAP